MCGIAGILNFANTGEDTLESIRGMVGSMLHRGPDEQGVYLDDQIALGHARLSIIDIAGGTQPIHNEDQSVWIVYNGEVYNFLEHRADLEARGHRFYTNTDTEVILHLYEEFGLSCFEHLIGQFAVAIWDIPQQRLTLARDRVGIRPLFYTRQQNGFFFASEIKALASSGTVPLTFDPQVLAQIFTFWAPLPGRSAFEHIHEVPPGCYVTVDAESMKTHRYWQWPCPNPDDPYTGTHEEMVEELGALLEDSIRIRMRADVPVGSYVSGGLDSSGISAITKSKFNPNLHTFGIRFDDTAFDEGTYQEAMVSWLKSEHLTLKTTNKEIGQAFTDCVRQLEQPVLRTAPVPLFLLSKEVRDAGFKVVLTGEGADEVFGGYNIFREAKVRRFWAKQPESKLRPLLLKRLYPYVFKNSRMAGMTQAFFGKGLEQADDPLFSHLLRWGEIDQRQNFLSGDLQQQLRSYNPIDEIPSILPADFSQANWLTRAQVLEATLFMSQYLLSAQGDRPAMAHSVEIRLPYLDHRLIELAARVPASWKISGMKEKQILKDVLASWLPPEITKREKHPYRAPIKDALLGNELLSEFLTSEAIKSAGLFDVPKVNNLLRKLDSIKQPSERDSMALVGIASTQVLHHWFVDRNFSSPSTYDFAVMIDHRSSTRQSSINN